MIRIDSISFNHEPSATTRDALKIRKNQDVDVSAPEWITGMSRAADSPAAYTMDQIRTGGLTINVKFKRDSGDPRDVTVSAAAVGGHILGNLAPKTINFGDSLTTFRLFNIQPAVVPSVGFWDIAWNWRNAAGATFQTTNHRIYILVGAPRAPWGQPGSSFAGYQVPWTEVLDHACRQAQGARTVDEVAERLTRWVNSLGGSKLQYAEFTGNSTFTIPNMTTFMCRRFLDALATGLGGRSNVNCSDCATIVSSFANILGCNLEQSRIESTSADFYTNPVRKIGQTVHNPQRFTFHEMAWRFPTNGGSASLYDSCLQFDGDNNFSDSNFLATLAVDRPFRDPATGGYHRSLIAPTPAGAATEEQQYSRKRRKIGGQVTSRAPTDPAHQRRLEEEYDFDSWRGTSTPDRNLEPRCQSEHAEEITSSQDPSPRDQSDQQPLLVNYSSNQKRFSPRGWKLREIDEFKGEPDPFKLSDAIWSSSGDCSAAELRVLTYECSSMASARLFLLGLLGEFEKPGMKRQSNFIVDEKPVEIGDVAFADVDEMVVLFARANIVLLAQNNGRTLVPASQFAHGIDTHITSNFQPEKTKFKDMKRFFIPAQEISVGDEVPLQYYDGLITEEKETLFKFIAPSGQVFLTGDKLLYKPLKAGEQSITVMAQKSGQTARQVLKLSVGQRMSLKETGCPELDNSNDEEESVMPEVMGSWSSMRPRNRGGSANMQAEGFLHLNNPDANGEITGRYVDLVNRTIEEVTGTVTPVAPNSYRLVLRHPAGEGITRQYYGELVAIEDGDFGFQMVVGRFSNLRQNGFNADSAGVLDSQENGIWVATKP